MYKSKFLKYQQKYKNLLGGAAVTPDSEVDYDIEDLKKCEYRNFTVTPIVDLLPNIDEYTEVIRILKNINIDEYYHLMIIIGGKCHNLTYESECYSMRNLDTLVKEGESGRKTLVLVIDMFYSEGEEQYVPEIQKSPINENIHIQHLNIGISKNRACLINMYLNELIRDIASHENGLIIIINATIFLGSSDIGKKLESVNGSLSFLKSIFDEYIFEESFLKSSRIIIYTLMNNIYNLRDFLEFQVYLNFYERFTESVYYSFNDYFYKIISKEFPDQAHLKIKGRIKFDLFNKLKSPINNMSFLNYLIIQKLK